MKAVLTPNPKNNVSFATMLLHSSNRRLFFRSAISYLSVCVILLLSSCSGLENSEQENLRRNNAKADFILRNHDEFHYTIQTPKQRQREHYPWEGIK